MGHYTPQAHLKRFENEEEPGAIWMYDKKDGSFKSLPFNAVAQERYYYPPDVEKLLNDLLKYPGIDASINSLLASD